MKYYSSDKAIRILYQNDYRILIARYRDAKGCVLTFAFPFSLGRDIHEVKEFVKSILPYSLFLGWALFEEDVHAKNDEDIYTGSLSHPQYSLSFSRSGRSVEVDLYKIRKDKADSVFRFYASDLSVQILAFNF